jgi:lipopolysaccharide transport system ATP-binding protein
LSSPVIRVENIGKKYRVGEFESGLLRDKIADLFRNPAAVLRRKRQETFWALKDVSFEVQQGEVLGLIGRNGAGKSTLLKVLARITKPTVGHARIRGRVGSLLEVGTGFHPELSGRENVFLNGAVLGMRRREITRKFDEIVAFAEVEKFIDTPVKRYSSGMYIRLAFAVAAHLETEILFVDEVLSVGDSSFQKKCLGKMRQVSREGRTVIFVSHNMAAMGALATRALLIRGGEIAGLGSVRDLIDDYLLGDAEGPSGKEWIDPASAPGNENVRLTCVRAGPLEGAGAISVDTGVLIEIGFENFLDGITLDCTVYLKTSEGVTVFESGHMISEDNDSRRGAYSLTGQIPRHLLNAGRYTLDVQFGKDQKYVLFRVDSVASFEVENTATGRGWNMGVAPGIIRPVLPWHHSFTEDDSLATPGLEA